MDTDCEVQYLGMIDFPAAWELQETMAGEIARAERPESLLLLQHPHTYTFGRRGQPEHLLWDAARLKEEGVQIFWVDRGGDITYHGPGQLVGYPLLRLAAPTPPLANPLSQPGQTPSAPRPNYTGYLRQLETTLVRVLMRLGIAAGQINGLTGVWIQPGTLSPGASNPPERRQQPAKIASVGVKVDSRGITRHGFSLNISPDMHYWEGIIACGLKGHHQASVADFLDPPPSIEQVISLVIACFGEVFGYNMMVTRSF